MGTGNLLLGNVRNYPSESLLTYIHVNVTKISRCVVLNFMGRVIIIILNACRSTENLAFEYEDLTTCPDPDAVLGALEEVGMSPHDAKCVLSTAIQVRLMYMCCFQKFNVNCLQLLYTVTFLIIIVFYKGEHV